MQNSLCYIFLLISFGFLLYCNYFPDLHNYIYFYNDSWDWLVNGLHYAGYDVSMTYRPPLSPILYSILFKTNLDYVIPYLGLFYIHFFVFFIYQLLKQLFNINLALIVSIMILTNSFVINEALYIANDLPASVFSFTMLLYLFRSINGKLIENNNVLNKRFDCINEKKNHNYFYYFAVGWGLSSLIQYSPVIYGLILFPYFLFFYQKAFLQKQFYIGMFIFLVITLPFFIYRFIEFGNPFYSHVVHFELINPHVNLKKIVYYLWLFIQSFSIPTVIFFFAGLYYLFFILKNRRFSYFILSAIMIQLLFFIFIYNWKEDRFVLYWSFPTILIAGIGFYFVIKRFNLSKTLSVIIFSIVILYNILIYKTEPHLKHLAIFLTPITSLQYNKKSSVTIINNNFLDNVFYTKQLKLKNKYQGYIAFEEFFRIEQFITENNIEKTDLIYLYNKLKSKSYFYAYEYIKAISFYTKRRCDIKQIYQFLKNIHKYDERLYILHKSDLNEANNINYLFDNVKIIFRTKNFLLLTRKHEK